jgi:hypothetical protein
MSQRRRRRSSSHGEGDAESSPWRRRALYLGVGVLVLFLAANLAVSVLRRDEQGRFKGLVSEDGVATVAFWLPLLATAGAAAAGAWTSFKSWRRSERSTALWNLRAFVASLVFALALAIVTFEPAINRRWFAVVVAVCFAVQTSLFAWIALRGERRSGSRSSLPAAPSGGAAATYEARAAAEREATQE